MFDIAATVPNEFSSASTYPAHLRAARSTGAPTLGRYARHQLQRRHRPMLAGVSTSFLRLGKLEVKLDQASFGKEDVDDNRRTNL
jgi:hypothetical protein